MQLSLMVALGYLAGCIETGKVTLQQFCEFTETDWSNVPDGQKHFEPDPAAEHALTELAKKIAERAVTEGVPNMALVTNALQSFGYKLAQGEVSPASLAILCDCSISDFEPQIPGS